jgi:ADP-ribosyl-[dinitrogen reductase] hydrolase
MVADEETTVSRAPDPDRDPLRGAWIGMALGDALGSVHAGRPDDWAPGTLVDLVGGGPDRLPPGVFGAWTSLALGVAEGLIGSARYEPDVHAAQVRRWWREGRWSPLGHAFGPAPSTRAWLIAQGGEGIDPGTERHQDDALAAVTATTSYCRVEPTQAIATAARAVETIRPGDGAAGEALARQLLAALTAAPAPPLEAHTSTHLVEAVDLVAQSDGFEPALRRALASRCIDGALGALVGQLAGARYGLRSIPVRWRAQVAWGREIVAVADRLHEGPAAGAQALAHPWQTWSRVPSIGRR